MNLVQLQEQLKDLPMQAVQSYMNGANPQVPPYLAAAELQRRQSIMKSQQAQQGAAQGKQPSIKEQLEQATGLMGLQAQRAQQGMQQVAQQAQQAPMPATEGTPQPEPQPEPEVGMAGGGIVSIPVRESMFRAGGVVGFAEGGAPMSAAPGALEALIKKRDELRKLGMDTTKIDQQIAAMQGGVQQGAPAIPEMSSKAIYQPVMQRAMEEVPEPTEEQQIASIRKLEEGAGMPDVVKRLQGLEEKYAKATEGRGLENLIRGFGSAGAGRGAVGLAAADAAARDRAADMEHAKGIADIYGGMAKDRFGALTQGFGKAREASGQMRREQLSTLGKVFGDVSQAESNEAQRRAMLEQARIYAGARGAGGGGDFKQIKEAAMIERAKLNSIKAKIQQAEKAVLPDQEQLKQLRQDLAESEAALSYYQKILGYPVPAATTREPAAGGGSDGKTRIDFVTGKPKN